MEMTAHGAKQAAAVARVERAEMAASSRRLRSIPVNEAPSGAGDGTIWVVLPTDHGSA